MFYSDRGGDGCEEDKKTERQKCNNDKNTRKDKRQKDKKENKSPQTERGGGSEGEGP